MIVDKGTVNRGELPLDPLLARYGDYWRLSSTGRGDQALVRTDEAREIRGARGKRSARPEFFTLHRALGLKQKSSYHHGLEKHLHGAHHIPREALPCHPPQEFHCQVQEHANKLVHPSSGAYENRV